MTFSARIQRSLLGAVLAWQLVAPLSSLAQIPADSRWVATWGTAQQYLAMPPFGGGGRGAGGAGGAPASGPATSAQPPPAVAAPARRFPVPARVASIKNQTVRMVIRTSVAGSEVRVRFANALGATAVSIGAARLALSAGENAINERSNQVLTFGGRPTATLYAGAVLLSDPIRMAVPAQTDLVVSVYTPGTNDAPTSHWFGLRPTYLSTEGDFTASREIVAPQAVLESYYWLAGVDVLAPSDAGTLVTFGDSITDGDQSTPGALGMWPAKLAARLQEDPSTRNVGVVNAGIAGNRVLGDGNSGLARFQAHALAQPGVKWITILEGINDISGATRGNPASPSITSDDLIFAYRQMIAHAHARGVKVIGCTLTPYGGSSVYNAAGEALRTAVNTWIRTSGEFDAVVDFDAATRDPNDPTRLRPEADSPDLLHPGDGGYKLMADAFDLTIFKRL